MTVRTLIAATAVGAFCSASCGYSEEEMQAKDRTIQELKTDLANQQSSADAKISSLSSKNDALTSRLQALGENMGNLESDLEETNRALEQLRERERQQQARLATFRKMMSQLKSMIDAGKLQVKIVRNRMVVELPENVLFDSGRAELKKQGQETLTELSKVLKTIKGREFQVAGHTDNVPIKSRRFPSNWELSTARAGTVAHHLMKQGMSAERLSVAGHADTKPVAKNDSAAGKAKNRRIEIVLMPNLDELPDLSELNSEP